MFHTHAHAHVSSLSLKGLGITLLTLALGCSSTSTAQLAYAPPKHAGCELEVITLDMTDPAFNQKWRMLGNVAISGLGDREPFSPEVIAELKPKACELGGDGVAVMKASGGSVMGGGSSVNYMVFQDKSKASVDPSTPSKI